MMDAEALLKLLKVSVLRCIGSSRSVAVAYSGGLDSAVVERIAREHAETRCYTCAVRGSYDHIHAPESADEDGIDLELIDLDRARLTELVSKACTVLDAREPLKAAYSIPILCVVDASREEVVLVGSGADELFGGYAKYLESDDPESEMAEDIKKMQIEHDLLKIYAESVGKRLEAPFTSPDIIAFARGLPTLKKLDATERKIVLREVARILGVSSHDSPKKAAQYSSGVMREMKRMARERGVGLLEWTVEAAVRGNRIP